MEAAKAEAREVEAVTLEEKVRLFRQSNAALAKSIARKDPNLEETTAVLMLVGEITVDLTLSTKPFFPEHHQGIMQVRNAIY